MYFLKHRTVCVYRARLTVILLFQANTEFLYLESGLK